MLKNEIEAMLESGVPTIPDNIDKHKAVEYVGLVYDGMTKIEAFRTVFKERSDKLEKKAIADRRNVNATLMYNIGQYERGKYVSQLYSVGAENYFTRFVDKRTRLLDEMYEIGMDKNEKMTFRLNASKIFLSSIPEPEKKIHHSVEVDVKDSFQAKLIARQKQLYSIANKEEDILDAEVTD